jgi:predicted transposase YbfD/YdcC
MSRTLSSAIFTHFEKLTDPRIERTRAHKLLDIMTIALCATICGANTWTDVERFGLAKQHWFAKFLELPGGIPSHDTFGRVFAMLDTAEFDACLRNWLRSLHKSMKGQGIAIDGKTLRRSFDTATGRASLHSVSAWAVGLRLSLGQVAVDEKSNEITAVPRLLELLEIAGAVVTLDAMHCQTETAAAIRAKQADYVLNVKANQPKLFERLQQLFERYVNQDFKGGGLRVHKTTERSHGRDERREYYVAPAPKDLIESGQWAGLQSVVMVYRHREVAGKETDEVHYYISSLPPKVKRLAEAIRDHWGIENSLHWVLDVVFSEDDSRIRKGNGPETTAMLRRLALSILEQDTSLKSSIRGKRLQAGWNDDLLAKILTGFSGN